MTSVRVRWFEDSNGSPSFNHCWMIWDRQHRDPPTLAGCGRHEMIERLLGRANEVIE